MSKSMPKGYAYMQGNHVMPENEIKGMTMHMVGMACMDAYLKAFLT